MSSLLSQPRRRLAAGALALAAAVAGGPLSPGASTAHAAAPARGFATTAPASSTTTAGFTAAPEALVTNPGLRPGNVVTDALGTTFVAATYTTPVGGYGLLLATNSDGTTTTYVDQNVPAYSEDSGVFVVPSGTGTATVFYLADVTGAYSVVYTATYSAGYLGAPVQSHIVVPDGSRLLAVTLGPDGKVWTVIGGGVDSHTVTVRDGGEATGTDLTTPYAAIDARLAFDAAGDAVLAVVPTDQMTKPVAYAVTAGAGGSWSPFSTVAHTWNQGDAFDLVSGRSGVHLVASTDAPSYSPVVAALTSRTFGAVHLTGDTSNCAPQSHDLSTDASGRVADVSAACNKLRLANLPDASHEGYVDLPSGGVLADGAPHLSTLPDGTGWMSWATTSGGYEGDTLYLAPVLLPAAVTSQTRRSDGGSVTVTGPRSCLPPVDVQVGAKAKAGKGWHAGTPNLKLGSRTLSGGVLHGSTLTAGTKYTLTASGDFSRKVRRHHHEHTEHSHAAATLTFTTCSAG